VARHQLQRRCHFVLREHVQKRRLVESNAERGLERVIENRVARTVAKVGENDGVFVGEGLGSMRTMVEAACNQCDQ